MMNFLALGLVLTTLVTAGFFSPSPKLKPREDVIVKEGHRVVVVEYEKDDGNTKVLISPKDSQTVDERLSEKMEGVKEDEVGNEEEGTHHAFRPRELVCDAYGKCKHKIASAFGKTKEAASETAHEAADKVYGMEEAAREGAGKVKDTVTQTANKAYHKVQAKDSADEASGNAKEEVSEKASGLKNETARKMEGAKEMVADRAKVAEEAADRAKKGGSTVRKEGHKELREIMQHAREVAGEVLDYLAPRERVAPVAGILHLMGFAAAYGICLWITFASSYVLAKALPRQQFAMVQTKIYPVYFKAMVYSLGMALLGHLVGSTSPASTLNLASSLAMVLTNLLWLEPRATKVMLERMKKEKEEGPATAEQSVRAATDRAGKGGPSGETAAAKTQIVQTLHSLNFYSSFLNASTLLSLTWHLVHLGQRLHSVLDDSPHLLCNRLTL